MLGCHLFHETIRRPYFEIPPTLLAVSVDPPPHCQLWRQHLEESDDSLGMIAFHSVYDCKYVRDVYDLLCP